MYIMSNYAALLLILTVLLDSFKKPSPRPIPSL